jgi:integrase
VGYLYRPKYPPEGKTYKVAKADGTLLESRVWWMKYYVNGRARRESTGTAKESEARRALKLREGAAATGAPLPPRLDRILYDELAADLKEHYRTTGRRSLGEVEDRLKYLDRFFGGRRATSIGPADVTAYVAGRQAHRTRLKRLTSNRTINIELALLRRLMRLGAENGKVLRVPPIKMLKEAPPREGFFEEAQYEAVRRRLPKDLQAAVAIAHTFGWRVQSEVLPLERRHIDLKVGTLRLDPGMTKNDEGRVVYLTPELKGLLAEQLDRVDQLSRQTGRIIPWVFPHLSGRHLGQRRRRFRKAWQTACRRAGVPGRLVHDFRRTAVRNMERAGVPRSVAMKLTGHRTESVYRRYAIVSDAELRDATLRLMGKGTGKVDVPAVDSRRVTP